MIMDKLSNEKRRPGETDDQYLARLIFGEAEEIPMAKVEIFLNVQEDEQGRSVGFFGWKPEHAMQLVYTMSVDRVVDSEDADLAIAEEMFEIFNIRHPEDYRNRSLSVGDMVVIDGRKYACMPVGFERVQ